MNITYDGISIGNAENIITFNDIPNILKISDDDTGTYATITLAFEDDITQLEEGCYITLLGETITGVKDYSTAVNKNFYMNSSPQTTAASVAKALRNCPAVIANFSVKHSSNQVTITARVVGDILAQSVDYYATDISDTYLTSTINDGSADSTLQGSLIDVDILNDGDYVTTLEKNFYNGECAFNLSPVLTTIAEIGKTKPYTFNIAATDKSGNYTYLQSSSTNYISQGYMVNQGNKFIALGDNGIIPAMNAARGSESDVYNNMPLYIYDLSVIPISFYAHNSGGMTITITYRDSAYQSVGTGSTTWTNTDSSKKLWDINIALNGAYTPVSYYIDIQLGSIDNVLRYTVIRPKKAAEYSQRIYWRNSYGGISFFDFTGQRAESRDIDISTYQKNIYDYYDSDMNELDKIYDNDVRYTVTLKSHLFDADGRYIFNDLAQSPLVWTIINDEKYAIIIDSISVDEVDNNNDVYNATLKYHLSQNPSII